MSNRIRRICLLCLPRLALVLLVSVVAVPAWAQSDEAEPEATGQEGASQQESAAESEMSRKERKAAAKERRIQEYLRRREERQALKAAERQAREQARIVAQAAPEATPETTPQAVSQAEEIEAKQIKAEKAAARQRPRPKPAPVAVAEESTDKTRKSRKRQRASQASGLPRGLARAQDNVRSTALGLDPTVQEYLVLIDQQRASPQQLAAFGSFLAQNGMTRDALEYYNVALRIDDNDPTLWVNRGTLQMQTRDYNAAASSFTRALALNPNHSVAHYNLGASFDEMNRYDDAVAAYKMALMLDPSLGDPVMNPQAANNDLLLAVRLMLYQETDGSLTTPLLDVDTGRLPRPYGAAEDEE